MHPTPDLLAAFDAGQLPQSDRDSIERHVAGCPECCRALERLPENDLAALIRSAVSTSTPVSGETPPPTGSSTFLPHPELLSHPRYHVLGLLGSGGMGVVYRALQVQLDRIVAVKVLHRRLTKNPGFAERFGAEVKALARLNHPNVVAAHDADRAGDLYFLVMEFVEGESLEGLVRRRGPLPIDEARGIIEQAANGLQHAFENGIVHRDVKPGNLLLTRGGVVKVVDFGLSRMAPEGVEPVEPAQQILGTPEYMAPEQSRDPDSADTRSDLYALGCTLYFLLTGRPPFAGATPLQLLLHHQETAPPPIRGVRPDVPPGLELLLTRLLSKDPQKRFNTPAELAGALAAVKAPASIKQPQRTWPWPGFFVAAVVASAVVGVALFPRRDVPPEPFREATPDVAAEVEPPGPKLFEIAPMPRLVDPDGLATADQLAERTREAAMNMVAWVRENNAWGTDHRIAWVVRNNVEKNLLKKPAGFQVRFGAKTVKSGQPTLLMVRYGVSYSFELTADQAAAVGLKNHDSVFTTLPTISDSVRARPTVELSNLHIDQADGLTAETPFQGTVSYRFLSPPRPGGFLRLMYYLPDTQHLVMINHTPKKSLETQGEFRFRYEPLGFGPFRDEQLIVLFAEWVSRDGQAPVVEGPAAVTLLRLRFK